MNASFRFSLISLACVIFAVACTNQTSQTATTESKSASSSAQSRSTSLVYEQNFEQASLGLFKDAQARALIPNLKWTQFYERFSIVDDPQQGQVLQTVYPAKGVGPSQSGGQFNLPIAPAQEYTLSYKVFFEEGFEWVLGGKLPGLTSGGETYTGGVHPTEGQGWSARYMWRADGDAVIYLYSVDNKKPWGEDIALNVRFEAGKWYELTQRIVLNDPYDNNAILQVWVNGEQVLDKRDFRLRIGDQGYIDTLYFSTFHGGNKPNWAPTEDVYARFDDFRVF
ncbi:polysaccharide lyase [Ningiella sp. W23]|uniref:polysaccharide lyase n=1 Tax=Ningiella sp. W23 TaxID=3023715 RepID=UPI0037562DC6